MRQLTTIVIGLTAIVIVALIGACMYWPVPIDPPPPPEPVEIVCTEYTEVTQPDFVGSYMIMDSYFGDRVLNVFPHKKTLHTGDDIGKALDSLLNVLYPQYTHKVYVNDTDDRLIYALTEGTSNKAILEGKLWIQYNGVRHYFGVTSQSLQTVGACSCDELFELIQEYRSMRYISWYGMSCDSAEYIKHALAVIEHDSCKAGRDWLDFRHNPFPMIDSIENLAEIAGWNFVGENLGSGGIGEYTGAGIDLMFK